MAFESGVAEPFDEGKDIGKDATVLVFDEEKYNTSLKVYQDRVIELNKQIALAIDTLTSLTEKIEQRKRDLEDAYNQRIEDVGSELAQLKIQRDQLIDRVDSIQSEITVKEHQRDTVLSALASREEILLKNEDSIRKQTRVIADANTDIYARRAELDAAEKSLEQRRKDFEVYITTTQDQMVSQQMLLDSQRKRVEEDRANSNIMLEELHCGLDDLEASEKKLEQDRAAAVEILNQAYEIKRMADDADYKLKRANEQEKINTGKEAELSVLQIALAIKDEKISRRERIVQQAESNIKNNVNPDKETTP